MDLVWRRSLFFIFYSRGWEKHKIKCGWIFGEMADAFNVPEEKAPGWFKGTLYNIILTFQLLVFIILY